MVEPKNIVGVHEAAVALGCAKQQIAALRKRPDFPAPVTVLAASPIWDLNDIEAFRNTWQRRSQRASKPIPEAVPDTTTVPTLMEQAASWNSDSWL